MYTVINICLFTHFSCKKNSMNLKIVFLLYMLLKSMYGDEWAFSVSFSFVSNVGRHFWRNGNKYYFR